MNKLAISVFDVEDYPIDGTIEEQNEYIRNLLPVSYMHLHHESGKTFVIPYIEYGDNAILTDYDPTSIPEIKNVK